MSISILGFVPARKGSKGVKNKNLRNVNGSPLIEYTLNAAIKSKYIDDILVSTDSEEIQAIAKQKNLICKHLRPNNLSNDSALTIDVIKYELLKLGKKLKKYTHLMLLQPTCPLRGATDIDLSIEKLVNQNGKSLISVVSVKSMHPLRMKKIQNNRLFNYIDIGFEDMRPRQSLPDVFIRNGAIYLALISDILEKSTLSSQPCIPFIMEEEKSINIDNESDLILAKFYLEKNKK